MTMPSLRKFALAAAALAVVAAASLAVSTAPADAKGKGWGHHHHGHHFGHRHFRPYPVYSGLYEPCLRRVWTVNRHGRSVLRTVNVCD